MFPQFCEALSTVSLLEICFINKFDLDLIYLSIFYSCRHLFHTVLLTDLILSTFHDRKQQEPQFDKPAVLLSFYCLWSYNPAAESLQRCPPSDTKLSITFLQDIGCCYSGYCSKRY